MVLVVWNKGSAIWVTFLISCIHFSLMLWKEEGMTTEKQSRKTSVLGYTRGLRLSKSSCPGVRYAY